MYKSLLALNEECIFDNVPLMKVKMKSGIMKVINMIFFFHFIIQHTLNFYIL